MAVGMTSVVLVVAAEMTIVLVSTAVVVMAVVCVAGRVEGWRQPPSEGMQRQSSGAVCSGRSSRECFRD